MATGHNTYESLLGGGYNLLVFTLVGKILRVPVKRFNRDRATLIKPNTKLWLVLFGHLTSSGTGRIPSYFSPYEDNTPLSFLLKSHVFFFKDVCVSNEYAEFPSYFSGFLTPQKISPRKSSGQA